MFRRRDRSADADSDRLGRIEDLLLKLTEYAHDEYALHEGTNATLGYIAEALAEHNERERTRAREERPMRAAYFGPANLWPTDENGLR